MAQNAPEFRGDVENPNAAHLKKGIAGNVAAGKVNIFDPAAAPLGTDEEAAGYLAAPEEMQKAASLEAAPRGDTEHGITANVGPGWRPYHFYLTGILGTPAVMFVIYLATR